MVHILSSGLLGDGVRPERASFNTTMQGLYRSLSREGKGDRNGKQEAHHPYQPGGSVVILDVRQRSTVSAVLLRVSVLLVFVVQLSIWALKFDSHGHVELVWLATYFPISSCPSRSRSRMPACRLLLQAVLHCTFPAHQLNQIKYAHSPARGTDKY
jgi:hypothetical protein